MAVIDKLDMDKLSERFVRIARPKVEAALKAEVTGAAAEAWREEAKQALGALLEDAESLRSLEEDAGTGILMALKQGLEIDMNPDQKEIDQYAKEVGLVLASSWLQFLWLALEESGTLNLKDNLLPEYGDVNEDLWQAFYGSMSSLVIKPQEVLTILQTFAKEPVLGQQNIERIELPLKISLLRTDKNLSFVASRSDVPQRAQKSAPSQQVQRA